MKSALIVLLAVLQLVASMHPEEIMFVNVD